MSTVDEDVRILESVVCFVDPKSPGSLGFLGGKERIRITLKKEHHSLDTFRRHIVEHASLKAEAEKRGIGSSIELKLCQVVKTTEGSSIRQYWSSLVYLHLCSPDFCYFSVLAVWEAQKAEHRLPVLNIIKVAILQTAF